jgi:hypothetical protein
MRSHYPIVSTLDVDTPVAVRLQPGDPVPMRD